MSPKLSQLVLEARRALNYVTKKANALETGERTWCKKGGRFQGVSVGRDKDGFYVFTHRARSKSYPSAADIPKKVVTFIRSTG
jgi:hypothetical protein